MVADKVRPYCYRDCKYMLKFGQSVKHDTSRKRSIKRWRQRGVGWPCINCFGFVWYLYEKNGLGKRSQLGNKLLGGRGKSRRLCHRIDSPQTFLLQSKSIKSVNAVDNNERTIKEPCP